MIEQAKGLVRRRIVSSLGYSIKGLKACYVHEEAFRVEVFLAVLLLPLGLWLGETPVERILLAGSVLLVLIVELLNSAVETAIDRIGLEENELSARAKDQGSAAVFLALVIAALFWITLLVWPVASDVFFG